MEKGSLANKVLSNLIAVVGVLFLIAVPGAIAFSAFSIVCGLTVGSSIVGGLIVGLLVYSYIDLKYETMEANERLERLEELLQKRSELPFPDAEADMDVYGDREEF